MPVYSEKLRHEVKERDGYRCQICGRAEDEVEVALHVHHVEHRGMGGKTSVNIESNLITLCSACHEKVHSNHLHIDRWTGGELILTDMESRRIPDSEVWFNMRQEAERLEKVEARIQGLAMIEGDIARDLWELSKGYKLLDPDMASFSQYIAGRNVSANKATQAARAYGWMDEWGLVWPAGLTSEKADIIRKAMEDDFINSIADIDAQVRLDAAVDQSVSDLKQELIDAGLMKASVRWYVYLRPNTPIELIYTTEWWELIRARNVEKVLAAKKTGDFVIRADKFVAGLNWDRTSKVLSDRDGKVIPYKDLT